MFDVLLDTQYYKQQMGILGKGFKIRHYVNDTNFTGMIIVRDLKTTQFIEGRIYKNGKIIQYMLPKKSPSQKAMAYVPPSQLLGETGSSPRNGGTLPEVTVTTSYPPQPPPFIFPRDIPTRLPDPQQSDPSNYKIGGGGGSPSNNNNNDNNNQVQQPKTPCDWLKEVTSNIRIQNMMQDLKNKLSDTIEYGYTFRNNGNDYADSLYPLAKDGGGMIFPGLIDGAIHSHTKDLQYIFSIEDIYLMIASLTQQKIRNAYTFMVGVVTSQNTYILKIENVDEFISFANKYKDVSDLEKEFRENKYKTLSGDERTYELATLNFLKDFNTGLVLYKTKTNQPNQKFNQWTSPKVSSDRQNVSNYDCK